MNSNPTLRWLTSCCMAMLLLLGAQQAHAQCDIAFPATPATIGLTLDPITGTASLTRLMINGAGYSTGTCTPMTSAKTRLYADQAKTTYLGTAPYTLDCSDLSGSQPIEFWVAFAQNAGDPPNDPNESEAKQFFVQLEDITPPVVTCPVNAVRNTNPGACTYTTVGAEFNASATDNCGPISYSYVLTGATTGSASGSLSGVPINQGATTITWTASDSKGNTSACFFSVNVSDAQAPNPITCPTPINPYGTDNGVCFADLSFTAPAATDNCPGVTVTWAAPGAVPASGIGSLSSVRFAEGLLTTVTFTATDAAMNTATCNFNVLVQDDEKPVITCPTSPLVRSASLPASCSYTAAGTEFDATAIDNCVVPTLVNNYDATSSLAGSVFPIGTTNVIWTALDGDGNTSSCTIAIQVNDNSAPGVTPAPTGQNFTFPVTAGDCSKVVTFTRPTIGTVSDCSAVTFTETVISGPDPNVLTGAPAFPPMGGGSITVQFPAGVTVVRYQWKDAFNNEIHVDYTFDIDENEAPDAECTGSPILLTLDPQIGEALLDPSVVDNGSSDNCAIDTITVSPNLFDCTNLGSNMVTLTVKDESGNMNTCTATVFVTDNTSPVVSCPTNVTIPSNASCSASIADLIFTQAAPVIPITVGPKEYFDNAIDPCGVTFEYKINSGSFVPVTPGIFNEYDLSGLVFSTGVTTVTVRVLDGSLNSGTCSFSVNVTDQAGPTFNDSPANVPDNGSTVNLNTVNNGCFAQYSWNWPAVSDACSPPVTTLFQSHQPGAIFPLGTTTVSWLAKDALGNIGTYTFNVVVADNQNPVAKCKDATVQLDATGNASIPVSAIDNGSSDNCSFSLSPSTFAFDCIPLGANIVTMTATDFGGRTSTCTATVTVQDLIAPTVTCQSGTLTVNLTGTTATILPNQIYVTSTDNCSKTDSIKLDAGGAYATSLTVGCPQIGLHTVFLKVTDPAGNVNTSCSRQVNVVDAGAPSITAPGPMTVSCDVYYAQSPFNSGTPTATDNCATPTVTYTDGPITATCANGFTFVRTWKASDGVNMSTATQVITVQDVIKPVLSLSSPIIVNSTQGPGGSPACSAQVNLAVQNNQVSDNCTDDAEMSYSYYIQYPTPPNNYGFTNVGSAMSPVNGNPGLTNFPIGVSTVTYIAKDECGNTTAQTITVEVKDAIAPTFNYPKCGEHVVLPNTSGACSNLYSWIRPWSSVPNVSDCNNFTVSESISNATVQQAVNLSNPFNYNGFFFQVFVTAQFPVGVTTVSYTATDASNNVSVCSFTVEIKDTQVPQLTCPGNQILTATCPTAQVPDYRNLVLVSDNCPGNVALTQTFAPGTTLGAIFAPNAPLAGNTFPIKIKGQDAYNADSCTFLVTLQDGQAPIPSVAVLPMLVDSCGGFVIEAPSATDPCNPNAPIIYGTPSTPVGTFIPGAPPKYNLMPGNYVITWLYDDGNGNITSQPQNITVLEDVFPPQALCKSPFTVHLNSQGLATVTTAQLDNGSNDPNDCGPITLSLINSILDCSELGDATVSLVVTDHTGNKDTCSVTVTVVDQVVPVLESAPNDTIIQACELIPDAVVLSATDNCDDDVEVEFTETSTQTASGYGFYNYTITRLWVATDTSGNTSSATQLITVADTEAPAFLAGTPDTIVIQTAADDLTCSALLQFDLRDYVTDCATGDDIIITNVGGVGTGSDISGYYGFGEYTITFTVRDSSLNQSTYELTVIVEDATPPNAVCINGLSAALQPSGTVSVADFQFNNLSFDNCYGFFVDLAVQRLDEVPLQAPSDLLTFDCADADGVTHHPVKLYVTDPEGNESSCLTYIVIQDNVAPVINFCPPSKTVVCSDNLSPDVHQYATATDNCASPNNPVIIYSDTQDTADANSMACYLIHRVWMATDQAGNTSTCVQTFSVIDTIAPVLSAYNPDITVSCEAGVPSPLTITATDNCSLNVPVDLQEDTINVAQGPCGNYSYTIVRTRTAVDDCGNVTVHVRNITVVDTTAPSFPGLQDTLQVYSANSAPNTNCTVPVNFAVTPFDCSTTAEMLITNDAPFGDGQMSISGDYPVGTYKIFFSAVDACGNTGVDSLVLEVIDNSIPTVVCNNNVVVSLGSNGSATIQPEDIDLGSIDNCAIDTMYLDHATFDCGNLGINPVTLSVVDVNGNINTCTVNVNVTLGVGSGLSIDVQGNNESFFGAEDGDATVVVTGGSGSVTYEWSTDETTASISSLTPGTYYVTVYDQNSGCQQVDSITIAEGAKIKLTIGDQGGAQGETVSVPVSVENFTSVSGFTFTVNVLDPAIGTVVGVSGIDPSLSSSLQTNLLAGNNVAVLWTDLNPLTLPDGTILFYVDVQLGTAPLGSNTPVAAVGTPVALNFTVEGANGPVDVTVDQMTGSVEITQLVNTDVTLAGDIKTWINPENPNSIEKPVANVTVNLAGTVTNSEITTAAGTYDFDVPLNANTTTSCSKVTVGPPYNAGVTAGDLLRIVNHIFGDTLPSPYQWIAADVNNTKTVTLADYLLIQRLALGTDQHIMNSPDWKFVPKSHMFPANNTAPFGPLTLAYPQTIQHNPADQDFLDDDFVAIRMGDVNGNTPVTLTNDDVEDRTGETFRFRVSDRAFQAGELVTIPFKASDFTNRHAYQMTIDFDPSVFELADMKGAKLELTDDNFGTTHLSDGHLTTLWVSREPVTLNDDEVLFTVTFRAIQGSSSLSKVMHVGSEITRAEAYNADGSTMKVDLEFVQPLNGLNEADFALYQNQPNPFREGTSIGFRLPESGRASLRVYNAAGQLVKLVVGNFEQGYNEVRFQKSDFGTPGVYWYELETPTHSDRKKMILID